MDQGTSWGLEKAIDFFFIIWHDKTEATMAKQAFDREKQNDLPGHPKKAPSWAPVGGLSNLTPDGGQFKQGAADSQHPSRS